MFNNTIKKRRIAAGIRQADIAKECGVGAPAFSAWENGKFEPKADQLIKIAEILNCTIEEILGLPVPCKVVEVQTQEPDFSSPDSLVPFDFVPIKYRKGRPIPKEEWKTVPASIDIGSQGYKFGYEISSNRNFPAFVIGDIAILRSQNDFSGDPDAFFLVEDRNGDSEIWQFERCFDGILLRPFCREFLPRHKEDADMVLGIVTELYRPCLDSGNSLESVMG